jgi:site-specific DNA-methyltransferase (adenine-specific)
VAKGIDKVLGATREKGPVKGRSGAARSSMAGDFAGGEYHHSAPATPEAEAWEGWGTALKPAWEPIVLARKPLAAGSVARQHMATGTAGLNIDAARIPSGPDKATQSGTRRAVNGWGGAEGKPLAADRWPANVCHDGSAEVLARFPVDAGASSARFFYSAKADAADRGGSDHPTVKPQALMRWLVRLTTARGGRVLDMFGGSGATGWAAASEGRECHLIERDPGYAAHIRARLGDFDPDKLAEPSSAAKHLSPQPDLFGG